MKNENKLALIVAYYLSKFNEIAYENIGKGISYNYKGASSFRKSITQNQKIVIEKLSSSW